MDNYKFYMRQLDSADTTEYELSERFPTLRVKSIKGLLVRGTPTNFYVESYVDSKRKRIAVGEESYSVNPLTMELVFFGETCATDYEDFYDFVSENTVQYRDNYRNKTVNLYLSKAPSIETDVRRDDYSYIEVTFTFNKIDL